MTTPRPELDRLVESAARKHDALAVAGLAGGEPSFHLRRASESSLFEIGSVTKTFTGVLLADMSLAGEVALDDPITKYLPADQLPRWKERAPTLEELATHRAALPNAPRALRRKELAFALGLRSADPWAGVDARTYRELVRDTEAARAPGGRFAYSSLGFGLLGDALAARAGRSYEQLLQERVSSPLGLRDTAVCVREEDRPRLLQGRSRRGRPRPPLRDHMPAAGAIRSSARAELDFLASSLQPPAGAPGPALRLAIEPRSEVSKRLSIGLGWMILRRKGKPDLIWHSGGTWGFRSFVALIPDHDLAVVVLSNTARSVDQLGIKVVDLLSALGCEAPARRRPSVPGWTG